MVGMSGQSLFAESTNSGHSRSVVATVYTHNYIVKVSSGKTTTNPIVASTGCFHSELAMHDFTAASG